MRFCRKRTKLCYGCRTSEPAGNSDYLNEVVHFIPMKDHLAEQVQYSSNFSTMSTPPRIATILPGLSILASL